MSEDNDVSIIPSTELPQGQQQMTPGSFAQRDVAKDKYETMQTIDILIKIFIIFETLMFGGLVIFDVVAWNTYKLLSLINFAHSLILVDIVIIAIATIMRRRWLSDKALDGDEEGKYRLMKTKKYHNFIILPLLVFEIINLLGSLTAIGLKAWYDDTDDYPGQYCIANGGTDRIEITSFVLTILFALVNIAQIICCIIYYYESNRFLIMKGLKASNFRYGGYPFYNGGMYYGQPQPQQFQNGAYHHGYDHMNKKYFDTKKVGQQYVPQPGGNQFNASQQGYDSVRFGQHQ